MDNTNVDEFRFKVKEATRVTYDEKIDLYV